MTRGGADLDKIAAAEDGRGGQGRRQEGAEGDVGALIALFKLALGDAVKDVRSSERLTDSAVCLVADEGDMDMHLERLLKQHRQLDAEAKRILEINPEHPLSSASRAGRPGRRGGSARRVRLAAARPGAHPRRRAAARSQRLRAAAVDAAGKGPGGRGVERAWSRKIFVGAGFYPAGRGRAPAPQITDRSCAAAISFPRRISAWRRR